MKKATLMALLLSFTLGLSSPVQAAKKDKTPEPTEIPAEVRVMLDRLEEIKAMDKSNLERAEKKALRMEVRAIKTQLRTTGNGIYISAGALIVILLLILIL
ncbi:hypothetical protein SAMN06265375_101298 [Muriicola jejuensis]|uniref:Seryl-tRNA synthetase n=1 Tax=Muriicola jejuensis TaxID=504488 RepID=A0A6P0UAE7_9FLAO|nr:hypothetical protein [Muriicola jejuensis]NER10164.1 hypothetical protein [Muriicola jejuensis]SMP02606.1 hypothetical protein SAMN06265375_101298 [Muriicola jejuensis]